MMYMSDALHPSVISDARTLPGAGDRPGHPGLDCFYTGSVVGVVGSKVAVTACELPAKIHASVYLYS